MHSYNRAMLSPAYFPFAIAAAICVISAVSGGDVPHRYFQEWQPATVYNAFQLLLCALAAAAVALLCRSKLADYKAAMFWSIVCAVCAYLAIDELFQFHESSGPIAQVIRDMVGQPGKFVTANGQKIISYGNIVQASYFLIAGLIAVPFRREIFMHSRPLLLFGLCALFLIGSEFLDFGMMGGHHVWLDPHANIPAGVFKAAEESLKLCGFALFLGGLLETMMAKREMLPGNKVL